MKILSLASVVSVEKLIFSFIAISSKVICIISLAALNIVLCLWFSAIMLWCAYYVFYTFIFIGVHRASWICDFNQFFRTPSPNFTYCSFQFLFSSVSGFPITTYLRSLDHWISCVFYGLFHISHPFVSWCFSLDSFFWLISSLIPSISFNLLLNLSVYFLISHIVFFNSRIFFWVFKKL